MSTRSQKLLTDDLQIGMFVSGIDRPWRETPFPIQGFHIEDAAQLEKLRHLCRWAYVDVQKSRGQGPVSEPAKTTPVVNAPFDPQPQVNSRELLNLRIRTMQNDRPYRNLTTVSGEMRHAKRVHRRIRQRIQRTVEALSSKGRLSLVELRDVANDLVDSVIRNPDAFIYLSRIESHNEDVLNYSIRVASWALVAGRHLNLARDAMSDLALAALLCKVGYTTVPREILTIQGTPTPHVNEMLKWSLVKGVKLLRASDHFSSRIVKLVSHHLERYDGSGFPRGVSGRHIPFLSQLIGLADYYENLVSYDFRDRPLSSADAVREVYEQRGGQFDAPLVEEFIQAIGLYPTGSVVELNESRLAVVIGQNKARLKPRLLILEDNRKPWQIFKSRNLDLSQSGNQDFIISSQPALPPNSQHRSRHYFRRAGSL